MVLMVSVVSVAFVVSVVSVVLVVDAVYVGLRFTVDLVDLTKVLDNQAIEQFKYGLWLVEIVVH
jgi:hypothetical protein